MKRMMLAGLLAGLISAGAGLSDDTGREQELRFGSADGVEVWADWLPAHGQERGVVVLFHQARSNARGEYVGIVPRLRQRGFSVLAVDLRSGGDSFDAVNRTVAGLGGREFSYCEAEQDMRAAAAVARGLSPAPVFVWGSSYSAGLALRLAGQPPEGVAAVLAFSPASGGPMADCDPMQFVDTLVVPVAVFRPDSEIGVPSAALQADALRRAGVPVHVVTGGAHGSSMLVPGRSQADIEVAWGLVETFLDQQLARLAPLAALP